MAACLKSETVTKGRLMIGNRLEVNYETKPVQRGFSLFLYNKRKQVINSNKMRILLAQISGKQSKLLGVKKFTGKNIKNK